MGFGCSSCECVRGGQKRKKMQDIRKVLFECVLDCPTELNLSYHRNSIFSLVLRKSRGHAEFEINLLI